MELSFDDGSRFELPFEYLRVYSPSAEVRSPWSRTGQDVLQTGKENIGVDRVEPVGRYALKIVFNDGHDTGLYTWQYLYELGAEYEKRWQDYLDRLTAAGYARQ